MAGECLYAQGFQKQKQKLVTFGLKYLQDCGWEPPNRAMR